MWNPICRTSFFAALALLLIVDNSDLFFRAHNPAGIDDYKENHDPTRDSSIIVLEGASHRSGHKKDSIVRSSHNNTLSDNNRSRCGSGPNMSNRHRFLHERNLPVRQILVTRLQLLRRFAMDHVPQQCGTGRFVRVTGAFFGQSGNNMIELVHGLWLAKVHYFIRLLKSYQ